MHMDSQADEAFQLAQTFAEYEETKKKNLDEEKAKLKIMEEVSRMRNDQAKDFG